MKIFFALCKPHTVHAQKMPSNKVSHTCLKSPGHFRVAYMVNWSHIPALRVCGDAKISNFLKFPNVIKNAIQQGISQMPQVTRVKTEMTL